MGWNNANGKVCSKLLHHDVVKGQAGPIGELWLVGLPAFDEQSR